MFICEHCGRKFNRKEGRTLHQKIGSDLRKPKG